MFSFTVDNVDDVDDVDVNEDDADEKAADDDEHDDDDDGDDDFHPTKMELGIDPSFISTTTERDWKST